MTTINKVISETVSQYINATQDEGQALLRKVIELIKDAVRKHGGKPNFTKNLKKDLEKLKDGPESFWSSENLSNVSWVLTKTLVSAIAAGTCVWAISGVHQTTCDGKYGPITAGGSDVSTQNPCVELPAWSTTFRLVFTGVSSCAVGCLTFMCNAVTSGKFNVINTGILYKLFKDEAKKQLICDFIGKIRDNFDDVIQEITHEIEQENTHPEIKLEKGFLSKLFSCCTKSEEQTPLLSRNV
jgi:hypothetical protein